MYDWVMSIGTTPSLLTVTEFGQLAPEVNLARYDNTTVSGILSQASQIVSDFLEYSPYAEDLVDEVVKGRVTTRGDLIVFPQKIPLVSVSSIKIVRGSTSIDVGLTDSSGNNRYNIDYQARSLIYPYEEMTLNGTVVFIDFFSLRNQSFFTRMSYRAGFEPSQLPGSIKQAAVLVAKDIFSKQFNSAGADEIRQGGISLKFGSGKTTSQFMKDAKTLLAPYVK